MKSVSVFDAFVGFVVGSVLIDMTSSCPTSASELEGLISNAAECASLDSIASCDNVCFGPTALEYISECRTPIDTLAQNLGALIPFKNCDALPAGCDDSYSNATSSVCATTVFGTGSSLSCNDGVKTVISVSVGFVPSGEADIDCGGAFCEPCEIGMSCRWDTDCNTGASCIEYVCETRESRQESSVVFNFITVPLLVFLALFTFGGVKYNNFREKKKTEKKKFREREQARATTYQANHAKKVKEVKLSETREPALAKVVKRNSSKEVLARASSSNKTVSGADFKLSHVLEDPELKKKFHEFCEEKFASENLLFWNIIDVYESLWKDEGVTDDRRQSEARGIVERFISGGGLAEVNIAYFVRTELMRLYAESDANKDRKVFSQNSFEEAKLEIYNLMNHNFFAEFSNKMKVSSLRKIHVVTTS